MAHIYLKVRQAAAPVSALPCRVLLCTSVDREDYPNYPLVQIIPGRYFRVAVSRRLAWARAV